MSCDKHFARRADCIACNPPRRSLMKCATPVCVRGATGEDGRHCAQHQGERSAQAYITRKQIDRRLDEICDAFKPTNPKDLIATNKPALELVPDTMVAMAAAAFAEGALKYGRYNWRIKGVKASVYIAAARRHLARYWNGEWADAVTGVPHISSALACLGIIADAHACGVLIDDRPPAAVGAMNGVFADLEALTPKLKTLFADKAPYQYTIANQPEPLDATDYLEERANRVKRRPI